MNNLGTGVPSTYVGIASDITQSLCGLDEHSLNWVKPRKSTGGFKSNIFIFLTPFHPIDNFAHRTEVQKALAKDKEWREQFLIPNLALTDKQESEITYLVPWCKLEKPPKDGKSFRLSHWILMEKILKILSYKN